MQKPRIPHNSWLLLCDGAKALVLHNEGSADQLNLVEVDIELEHHAPTRALGTDRPGRVYQSEGGSRSAMQETDWHDQAEKDFVSRVSERFIARVAGHDADDIFLVAPPRVLGMLRKHLDFSAQIAVTAEIAKDLLKFPIPEIERYLSE